MGKTTKDIADALDIAAKTVENHRNNLREKLGLRNKGVNLRSYLLQLERSGGA
jgi:DNA-binding CsgD family transcriptional regulator